jgi:D-sedoheptulose 7-phosphate isomerase
LEVARCKGMLTIGLAGYEGGRMLADFLFVAPGAAIPRIQEVHTTIYHLLWQFIQKEAYNAES